jgi:hypothetical protein
MPDVDARDRLIERIHRSSVYVGRVDARPVDNWNRLTPTCSRKRRRRRGSGRGRAFGASGDLFPSAISAGIALSSHATSGPC